VTVVERECLWLKDYVAFVGDVNMVVTIVEVWVESVRQMAGVLV
jgi:hypothetical protein